MTCCPIIHQNVALLADTENGRPWSGSIRELFAREAANPQKAIKFATSHSLTSLITAEWLTAVLGQKRPDSKVTAFQLGPPDEGTSSRRSIVWEPAHPEPPKFCFCTKEIDDVDLAAAMRSSGSARSPSTVLAVPANPSTEGAAETLDDSSPSAAQTVRPCPNCPLAKGLYKVMLQRHRYERRLIEESRRQEGWYGL
jgi:hypothetical protein